MKLLRITPLGAADVAQSMASYDTRRVPVAAFASLLAGAVDALVFAAGDRAGSVAGCRAWVGARARGRAR